MTSLKTPSAMATRPGVHGKSAACLPGESGNTGAARAGSWMARAWHGARVALLVRRLERIDAELGTLTARLSAHGAGDPGISKQDIAAYESCCSERAVLHALIASRTAHR